MSKGSSLLGGTPLGDAWYLSSVASRGPLQKLARHSERGTAGSASRCHFMSVWGFVQRCMKTNQFVSQLIVAGS